jgi:hypothetical protein
MFRCLTSGLFALTCAVAFAQDAAVPSVSVFLQRLIDDPGRTPDYGEGMAAADQVARIPAETVRDILPLVFSALRVNRDVVQVNAALVLHAVSLRADSKTMLEPRINDILGLLAWGDARVKMTVPMVLARMRAPNSKIVPELARFLQDTSQPVAVKTVIVCTLMQVAAADGQARTSIVSFFNSDLNTRARIDAINAIACRPTDDPQIAGLVKKQLDSKDPDVKAAAIQVIGRLGPRAIAASKDSLLRIANASDERPDVRMQAERIAGLTWDARQP